jgi:hypothetical protein
VEQGLLVSALTEEGNELVMEVCLEPLELKEESPSVHESISASLIK